MDGGRWPGHKFNDKGRVKAEAGIGGERTLRVMITAAVASEMGACAQRRNPSEWLRRSQSKIVTGEARHS